MTRPTFEWDVTKDAENRTKHGVGFVEAQEAFVDPRRILADDEAHSIGERRFFCLGLVNGRVLTVRFTYRGSRVRIIGAGYWRKGRWVYERVNGPLHG